MSEQTFLNNATGTLTVQAEVIDTTITVDAGLAAQLAVINFATDFILLTLTEQFTETSWEIVKATGIAGQVVTVVRAQEGTSAAVWPIDSKTHARWTEGSAQRARDQIFRLLYDSQGRLLLDGSGNLLIGSEV